LLFFWNLLLFFFCFFFLFFELIFFFFFFFFFNDTATTEIYTLFLHDALPIFQRYDLGESPGTPSYEDLAAERSEEHTSELQTRQYLVCRLLLEKKKKKIR